MSSSEIAFILGASAVLSAGLILGLRPLLRQHALAHPNARSSHRQPTPQWGGIAVTAATVAASVLAFSVFGRGALPISALWWLLGGTGVIALVGAIDDVRSIEVAPRLGLQAIAVAMALAALPDELRILPALPWWIERGLLLLGSLWFVNLTNFMDGIDWMTVAEVVPVAATLGAIGAMGALPPDGAVIAFALCGAVLGFAPFNRPIATLFLGDAGSLPIGLLLAFLLVVLAGQGHIAAALLLPLYYLADASITLLRRIASREPFWKAHRSHFYQRATSGGAGVEAVVAGVFLVNVLLAALALATIRWSSAAVAASALACGIVLVAALLWSFARARP